MWGYVTDAVLADASPAELDWVTGLNGLNRYS